tara:strand:- start:58 stop:231 length:174 start_codon:yes stop_codon:yes gene_type:complete
MSYEIVDTFRSKVLGSYETKADMEKAMSKLSLEDDRYKLVKPKAKKASEPEVNEESD